MGTVVTPWGATAALTSAVALTMGKVNRYNVSAGGYTVSLPALSTVSVGARAIIEKDRLDASGQLITVSRAGADTFDDATTSFTISAAGSQETVQVVSIGGIKYWKRFSGGSSGSSGVTLSGVETLSNKTLTAPKFADLGYIADANGVPILMFDTTASAVNGFMITDSATGSSPSISAVGNDTNIDLNLNGKGTGRVFCSGARVATVSEVQTLTNKRIQSRTITVTGGANATPAINTDLTDIYVINGQTVNITSFTSGLTGSPLDGDKLWVAITGTATRTLAWGAAFVGSTVALPSTTVGTARLDVGFIRDALNSVWRCVAVA